MKCPIVFRGPNGSPGAVGAQHSQCFAAWYMSVPGLVVLSPYDSEDARGLLKAAVRSPDPVIFLETEALYSKSFPVSEEALSDDFTLPIGKAKIVRQGNSVTIVSLERGVDVALEAANELKDKFGVECEVGLVFHYSRLLICAH
ncbi:pyruvate dehydrogenase E1 component subunit beta-1, mitochondrial-like [Octopus sinensis]|uniref:Pyruvate dehydrogenase E1 component subunit beta n=1 Tax=Octopus sinensis TaxID=2607531 RepID=A0A6P7TXE6_9MOLL|nr:pyruvate dehydrogenase E1 component subunit beta-1, mitochondrial-like [Octopus sinensis]